MGVGKETALRVRVRDAQVGMETIARIAQYHAAVAFAAGGIAQALVLQTNPVAVVLNAVRRHTIVGIVYQRGTYTVEPVAVPSAQLGRHAYLLVIGAPKELDAAAERLGGHVVGIKAQHATDGIAAVE